MLKNDAFSSACAGSLTSYWSAPSVETLGLMPPAAIAMKKSETSAKGAERTGGAAATAQQPIATRYSDENHRIVR